MSGNRRRLLDAVIEHLEELRAGGAVFVDVRPETLAALGKPPVTVSPGTNRPRENRTGSTRLPAGLTRATPDGGAVGESTPAPNPRTEPPSSVTRPVSATPALDSQPKAVAMAALRVRAEGCRKCEHLAASRKSVVFGVGNLDADLMFVGEAPGIDEDAQGEPFVGAAGQLLNKIIAATGLSRERVYIANILKCRPDTPGQRTGNRKPTPAEMSTCIPYLHEQIDLIRPKVLVALGGTAVEGLLGGAASAGISRLRGRWHTYRGIPLMPTFHPSYLLRAQSAATEKRKVWEDMLAVMEKLDLPISEKQRGYFQSAAR